MTDLDPGLLRAAFARYMTGVTVVTSRNARDEPVGFTANSFTSSDPAVHAVLSRFETEFRNQSFGLYVGDDRRGDVLPGARG